MMTQVRATNAARAYALRLMMDVNGVIAVPPFLFVCCLYRS